MEESPWHSLVFTKKTKKRERAYGLPAPLAPIADTHAHLTCFWTKNPAECLARAALAGVRQLTTLVDPIDDALAPEYPAWLAGQLDRAVTLIDQALAEGAEQHLWPDAEECATAAGTSEPTPDGPSTKTGRSLRSLQTVFLGRGRPGSAPGCRHNPDPGPRSLPANVRFLVGAHPYGAPRYTDAVHAQVEALIADPRCAGVGEIGLDYHFDADDDIAPAPHDAQIACMARQLELAVAHDLPVELHLRNDPADEARTAHADAYRVLREVGLPTAGCVLHCFGEERATMERFVELGCRIAYGGAATFGRNEPVREAFAATPLDRILFETDCPYMAPMPIRGLECEPAMIAFTVDALSRDRAVRTGEDPADIQWAAWENACALFGKGARK